MVVFRASICDNETLPWDVVDGFSKERFSLTLTASPHVSTVASYNHGKRVWEVGSGRYVSQDDLVQPIKE